jgi:CHAT domain-containing protein
LWAVSDDSTADLMTGFYRYRVREHLSLSEALRRAQLDLVRTEPTAVPTRGEPPNTRISGSSRGVAQPYYWAPFILMGNWQ